MAKISRETVDEILSRTDIEGLISSYVTLRRAGSNMTGLCPFHSERSPSFTVFPSDNSFYCFGCGVGGNAITFLRRIENLDFQDAVEALAKRIGITLQFTEDRDDRPRYDRNRIFAMNREAGLWFHRQLYADNPKAKAALAYFREKRRLSDATIKHFGLGFAPDSFDEMVRYMRSRGYRDDELVAGFLCGRAERSGNLFAAFRNRVMFPVIDVSGNIIAFGGRVMDDSKPKYKNSSDTPVFKKSKNLFALNFAHKHCAEQLILCEGYMDVIALHAAGFSNAVAALGTAITGEQARLMSRYTKKVIISTDADEAGQKAAERAMKLLEEAGLEVKILRLDGAKDPDEYIQKFGADRFRNLLEGSRSKFDFVFEKIVSKFDLHDPQQKIEACAALCREISAFHSSAERDIYVREVARRLDVNAESLAEDVEKQLRRRTKEYKKKESEKVRQDISGLSDRVNRDAARAPAAARAEEAVLGLLQLYPEYRKRIVGGNAVLSEEDFFTDLGKRCFRFLAESEEGGGFDPAMLDSVFTADEVGRITRMRVARMDLTDNGEGVFKECVDTLKKTTQKERGKASPMTKNDLEAFINQLRNENN